MRKFWDIYLLKPFSTLTSKEIYLRYLYRLFSYLGVFALMIIAIIIIFVFSGCGRINEKAEIRSEYHQLVYPEDTTVFGVVKSISTYKVKRFGDFLYSNSNNVLIQSDTLLFSVCVDDLTFNVNDSVKVIVERVKHEGEFNDIKTIIYPKFGNHTETYWTFVNLYYKELMIDELEKIK